MSCSAETCRLVSSSERALTCWICSDIWHVKCAGISARVVDEMYAEKNGLRWCCVKCRDIDVDFCKFFKKSTSEMVTMGRQLWDLYTRFSKFSSLLEQFPVIDSVITSPDMDRKRKKVTDKSNRSSNSADKSDRSSDSSEKTESSSILAETVGDKQKKVVFASPTVKKQETNSKKRENKSKSNRANKTEVEAEIVDATVTPTANVESGTNMTRPNTLSMAPAKKMVFVSRFDPQTTAEDLNSYIKSKIDGDFYLKTFKLKSSYSESRSSFKIIVPQDIFDKIIRYDFWPKKAFVKEFVDKADNLAHLPSIQPSSKN